MEVRSSRARMTGKAIASLVLGIVSLMTALLIALVGLVVGIVVLVLGIVDRRDGGRGVTTAGIVCSGAGTLLAIANIAVTVYLVKTGQIHMLGR